MNSAEAIAPLDRSDLRAAIPLYTVNEASRYLGTPYTTLLKWVRPGQGDPLVSAFPKRGHMPVLPFVGFAEAFVLAVAYRSGMKPWRIVENIEAIKKRHGGVEHVLASRLLYHDRAELLLADEHPRRGDLMVPRNNQMQLTASVEDQLKLITYGDDGFAERIVLPSFETRVVVDAREASGRPIVERTGTRVADVLGQFWANEKIADIAYDFELTELEVQDLIRAQTRPTT